MVLKQFDPVSLFLLLLMWTLFKCICGLQINTKEGYDCGVIGGIIDPLPHVFPFAGTEAQFM